MIFLVLHPKGMDKFTLKHTMNKCFTCLLLIFGSANGRRWQRLNEICTIVFEQRKKEKVKFQILFSQRNLGFIISRTVIFGE